MAREAGIINLRDAFSEAHVQSFLQDLKAFEALARADEREACARVCERRPLGTEYNNSNACAAAIRARGNT